jgi:predicted phage terminase large subunit-like protein
VAATEILRRRKARASLTEYARYIDVPGAPVVENEENEQFTPVCTHLAFHHEIILGATQRCINRHSGRTMLFLPPGSAKSTYASIVAPTWVMGKLPGFKVIGVSYGSDLARKFGRRTRSIVRQQAFRSLFQTGLTADSKAADEWALENGSEYMGGGILSGITGNRADFIPIDDPIKGRQEADSEVVRINTLEAYNDDVLTRLKPGGSLMITQTRWHEQDLAGSILPENYDGESGMIECRDGNTWEVICIPAKAEREDDPLNRSVGEYIWPEWFPPDHWKPFERLPRTWSALYQQRPSPETGDYFKADWIKSYDTLPPREHLHIYGGSDYAVTADGGDYTVHVVVGIDPDDRMYLLDLWREQTASDEWVESLCNLILKWKPIAWAEETGQIKSGVGPFLRKRMFETKAAVYREQFPTRGDKAIRAQSIRGRMALNGLYIALSAPFRNDLINEMMSFPVGVHDDQVDALGLVGQLIDKMTSGRIPKTEPEEPKELIYEVKPDGRVVANMGVRERVLMLEKKRKRDKD